MSLKDLRLYRSGGGRKGGREEGGRAGRVSSQGRRRPPTPRTEAASKLFSFREEVEVVA